MATVTIIIAVRWNEGSNSPYMAPVKSILVLSCPNQHTRGKNAKLKQNQNASHNVQLRVFMNS